jgi:23S rRNA (adenine2503-C2)-methyltransferase
MDNQKVQSALQRLGEPGFRLKQIRQAVFVDLVGEWSEVTTISKALRETLTEEAPLKSLTLEREAASRDGRTLKLALRTDDGQLIEAVLMRHEDGRRTVCVSSQAGCPMGCSFCATGKLGLQRNLSAEEMLDQVLEFSRRLKSAGERVSNVVVMGMGEPMHNLDNVLAALREMNAADGLAIGARRISVSTCGIVPGIERLAGEPEQFNLAVSLHAPTQDLRERMMPVAKAYPLDRLMNACRDYAERTGRKIFFEYLLISGLNDSAETAEDLADLMNHPLYHVNLIKYHSTGDYVTAPRERREAFMAVLEKRGVSVSWRHSYGEDIDAACGQLAGKSRK